MERQKSIMQDDNTQFECLVGEREVARQFGVSLATVRRWRLVGGGPRYIKVGASVKYRPSELTAFLNTRPTGGGGRL